MNSVIAFVLAVFVMVLLVLISIAIFRKKPQTMRRNRPPLMLSRNENKNMRDELNTRNEMRDEVNRNGRVVSPISNEKFVDQYTLNIPIQAQDPLWMTSTPVNSPWIGDIPNRY